MIPIRDLSDRELQAQKRLSKKIPFWSRFQSEQTDYLIKTVPIIFSNRLIKIQILTKDLSPNSHSVDGFTKRSLEREGADREHSDLFVSVLQLDLPMPRAILTGFDYL